MNSTLDNLRNQLLAALCTRHYQTLVSICGDIWTRIDQPDTLSEVDQKAINQILRIFHKFKPHIRDNCSPYVREMATRIRKEMAHVVRESTKDVTYIEYDNWARDLGLPATPFQVMLKTVASLQLTTGCSNRCRRCNEWALAGVRKHFSHDAVKTLLTRLHDAGNQAFSCYSASDPLDWQQGEKNIGHVLAFMSKKGCGTRFGLLTKIPRGSEKVARMLLSMDADLSVSMTLKNRERIQKIEQGLGKRFQAQHDDDNLLIPAGLDEDFETIKSSITDHYGTEITPEGAFAIIPTFTSALNPTGQCRLPITKDTDFFLEKKMGRTAWTVEYFKPLKAITPDARPFVLSRLLDAQIENLLLDNGSPELTPPGMMSLREYFKTYEPAAVQQRKRLFPSVLKDLEKKYLAGKTVKTVSKKTRERFDRQVKGYLASCDMPGAIRLKKNAFSYFLKAIAGYLAHHPAELEIIRCLREPHTKTHVKEADITFTPQAPSMDGLLEEAAGNAFLLFQTAIFKLLDDPFYKPIRDFIHKRPAAYDPELDRFGAVSENSSEAS